MVQRVLVVIGLIALGIGAVWFLFLREDDPFAASAISDPPFASLSYGIQAFLWWDGGEANYTLELIRMMNFSYVKQTFAWHDLEPSRGRWIWRQSDRIVDEIQARDLRLIVRLGDVPRWAQRPQNADFPDVHDTPPADLADWAVYCGTIAARYQGRVAAYQIWNEPNLAREWGGDRPDPAGYVAMLAACSQAIRAADPDAILISAGLSPTGNDDALARRDDLYLQDLYDLNFQQYVDVVGMHAPGFTAPEVDPADAPAGRWASFRRIEDLRKIMIANGDAARQVAILETGYTTEQRDPVYAWFAVDEATQARHLSAAYAYAAEHWRPWVGLMSAIYMSKPTWTAEDEEFWWSVTIPGNQPGQIFTRPAYGALVIMPKYCGDLVIPERDPANIPPIPAQRC
ncbi:MAG: cellulase family glycosylhydrolase [Anaerolineae bacterium]|jgi:hypothetical protein|nr:cellulase family glycosylhydrolase [Anaerolineae bacterium]